MLFRFIKKTPNINFIENRKIFFSLSLLLALVSILSLWIKGLNFGIDFKGGLLVEAKFDKNIELENLRNTIYELKLGDFSIQGLDNSNDNFLIKIELSQEFKVDQAKLILELKKSINKNFDSNVDYRRIEYVGPTVSSELIMTGIIAILMAIFSMLIYIWFRFELPFAIGAVIALVHDTILTIGMFSISSLEFNLSTVAAILLIIGYSMNDTVVVYDRVRENLKKFKKLDTFSLLNKSINETLSRTINTTATTILALLALFIFGGNIIKDFSLAMIWGIIIGTYSSILIATPILLNMNIRKVKETEE
ncbi:MAG: protein translocase subunit SecF [Pelagibacterales bacterium]|nr:protein translocase subunit SecF [Pelagibacterales bacterium]OUU61981.1 MAG: protein translocase subunit SecF [Alphaproteobacteria bacterium TMED62]|tara:strand:- start:4406 stop:5326 length:921 start_codon:yes stop_codon:yes gene_type:complete